MIELELLGVDSTGERLVLVSEGGERFTLQIDDSLRGAVRRDRPKLETKEVLGELRPKDLQALIRAGASAAEVAEAAGLSLEHVRKFESPVLGERRWTVERAQACRVGHEGDSPTLGDLVVDRLAARGVDPESLTWDAVRRPGEPWEVVVTFVQSAEEREARWAVDVAAGTVRGLDEQARWLTEMSTPAPPRPRRPEITPAVSITEAILDDLDRQRHQRLARRQADTATPPVRPVLAPAPDPVEEDGEEDAPNSTPPVDDGPQEHPDESAAVDTAPQAPAAAAEEPGHTPETKPAKKARRTMPTWEEIVFGSRSK
ncbi:septation protein SepH [Buchananella hordeovulneris]|uniref:DUF3071 domain-containing protein n=1 Tax=Buchananella hordeovulneris TaxID=52770 RepID=A0A1Q5PY00_9ACTO|nr:septation protein SepH [Buchananella hordeovulneris]OKL52493.1 hypothetical protein BSZ40_03280 [Buchananella hordeovulneris]